MKYRVPDGFVEYAYGGDWSEVDKVEAAFENMTNAEVQERLGVYSEFLGYLDCIFRQAHETTARNGNLPEHEMYRQWRKALRPGNSLRQLIKTGRPQQWADEQSRLPSEPKDLLESERSDILNHAIILSLNVQIAAQVTLELMLLPDPKSTVAEGDWRRLVEAFYLMAINAQDNAIFFCLNRPLRHSNSSVSVWRLAEHPEIIDRKAPRPIESIL